VIEIRLIDIEREHATGLKQQSDSIKYTNDVLLGQHILQGVVAANYEIKLTLNRMLTHIAFYPLDAIVARRCYTEHFSRCVDSDDPDSSQAGMLFQYPIGKRLRNDASAATEFKNGPCPIGDQILVKSRSWESDYTTQCIVVIGLWIIAFR